MTDKQMEELIDKFFLHDYYGYEDDVLFIDGHISVDTILEAADWIRGQEDNKPFSMKWLYDNIDIETVERNEHVDVYFSDIISDERGEAGHVEIIYMRQIYWTCSKGLAGNEWLCTCTPEEHSDDWIPSIYTIGDFKRLWRVATGYDLPLKKKEYESKTGSNRDSSGV